MKNDAKTPPPADDPATDDDARETGDMTTSEDFPIHEASRRGDLLVVQACLDDGADVESTGISGNRPLHLAAAGGHLRVIKCLLEAGASLDATNEDDATPASLALAHPECLALLRNAALEDVGALAKLRAESQAEAEIEGAESTLEEDEEADPQIGHAAEEAEDEVVPRLSAKINVQKQQRLSADADATVAVTAAPAATKSMVTPAIEIEGGEIVEAVKPITKAPAKKEAMNAGGTVPSKGSLVNKTSAVNAAKAQLPVGAGKVSPKASTGAVVAKPKSDAEKAKSTAAKQLSPTKKPPVPIFSTFPRAKEGVKAASMPKTSAEVAAKKLGNAPSALAAKSKLVEKISALGTEPKSKGKAEGKAVSKAGEDGGEKTVKKGDHIGLPHKSIETEGKKVVEWQNRW